MKVGDYVRTEDGIGKIISKGKIKSLYSGNEPYVILDINENKREEYRRTLLIEIIKSSPNIIDLIEVGDYVNGWRVNKIEKDFDYLELGDENKTVAYRMNYDKYTLKTEFIKSIVTKECFESMEYKVKE